MHNEKTSDIDFVIAWVDGNDIEWQKEKNNYKKDNEKNKDDVRYRDWNLLRYWFRGVENFAPWVRKVFFVTWGHVPEWLNTSHPKICIVNHKDYIPKKYLPTFNSHTIELNLHRIDGLSDKFVYFNDDMYIVNKVKEKDFFVKELPCDLFSLDAIYFNKDSAGFYNANNMEIINSHFNKKKQFKLNKKKWFKLRYSIRKIYRTMVFMPWNWFPGFYYQHLPSSFLKKSFRELWDLEYKKLDMTCMDKFRTKTNVNQWLFKYWQLAKGEFFPRRCNIGLCYHVKNKNIYNVCKDIQTQKYPLLCINDVPETKNYEEKKEILHKEFSGILNKKSSYEKV